MTRKLSNIHTTFKIIFDKWITILAQTFKKTYNLVYFKDLNSSSSERHLWLCCRTIHTYFVAITIFFLVWCTFFIFQLCVSVLDVKFWSATKLFVLNLGYLHSIHMTNKTWNKSGLTFEDGIPFMAWSVCRWLQLAQLAKGKKSRP